MITLGRLFSEEPPRDDVEHLRRALRLLMQGIEVHTLTLDQEDYASFRLALSSSQRQLEGYPIEKDVLSAIGDAIHAFSEYNRRTSEHVRTRIVELQSIIAALFDSVQHLVSCSDSSTHNLKDIQAQLSEAAKADDLRTVKTHLSNCLKQIVDEIEAHRHASEMGAALFEAGRKKALSQMDRTRLEPDSLTGLPCREEAEAALANEVERNSSALVVVFALPRLSQVNLRFGRATGNRLLELFATFVGSGLGPEDRLFRWTGPVLVAIIQREVPFERIRREVAKLVAGLKQAEIKIGDRMAMIPFSVKWDLFPISQSVHTAIDRIEVFTVHQPEEHPATPV